MKLLPNENNAVFCIRVLLHRYEGVVPRGEPNDLERKSAVQAARKRVLVTGSKMDL